MVMVYWSFGFFFGDPNWSTSYGGGWWTSTMASQYDQSALKAHLEV